MIAAVEVRQDFPGQVLDALADELFSRGYTVARWAHRMNPLAEPLARCDLAVIWNGCHEAYWPVKAKVKEWACRTLFCEVGWTDRTTFQTDHAGVNYYASWVQDPMVSVMDGVAEPGELLVLLDDEHYIHEAQLSPWVGGLHRFCKLICENSQVPVRVRLHPERQDDADLCDMVDAYPNCRMDHRESLDECFDGVGAVAAIATSAAIEGIRRELPVLCYGKAIYGIHPVSYTIRGKTDMTRTVTSRLAEGTLPVSRCGAREFVARLESHQYRIDEIQGMGL